MEEYLQCHLPGLVMSSPPAYDDSYVLCAPTAVGCSVEVWQYELPNPSFLPSIFFKPAYFHSLASSLNSQAHCLPSSLLPVCWSADWINPGYLWWPDPCIMELSHDTVYRDTACVRCCSPGWTDRLGFSDMTG